MRDAVRQLQLVLRQIRMPRPTLLLPPLVSHHYHGKRGINLEAELCMFAVTKPPPSLGVLGVPHESRIGHQSRKAHKQHAKKPLSQGIQVVG